ncbi:MAG: M16 family metallopeptidase [Pirellulales bacterium]
MDFLKHALKNGLEIAAECNSEAHSTAVGFFVETGSRDEPDELAGVSHFLEHMAFKGTPTRSADDVNREFDEMGAHYNAFTSEENTVFYAAVLPEFQGRAVELLGDIIRPSLREEDFATEKQVIVEEIRMYEDQPPFGADEKCKAAHYGAHPLGHSVLGTIKSVTDLDVEAMRAYFRERYSPRNITLVGAGRIDFDALVALAERLCGNWEPCESGRILAPPPRHAGFESIHKENATQQYAVQLSAGPSATDPDRYAAKILGTVLGDDTGSRFYWELIDPGLAEHASLSHYDYQGAGLFMTYLSCDPENAGANLQRILDIYRRAEAEGITPAELDQAKSKINSRVVLSSERPRGRLFSVGANWTQRQEYRSVRDDLEAVEALTLDEVSGVLAKFPLSCSTTVAIGPLAKVSAPR